jgi:hypothetical protein
MTRRFQATFVMAAVLGLPLAQAHAEPPGGGVRALDVRSFLPVEGPTSGPAVYYRVEEWPTGVGLSGRYRPPMETVTMGIDVPEELRGRVRQVRWRWRVRTFPTGGDECTPARGDSAASVSLAFKRGLKWYVLRYVWSPITAAGSVCDRKRNLFTARDIVVLKSGGEPDVWREEIVDVRRAFVEHFANGNLAADVPDLVGIGVMTDGDQTNSESAADWDGFELRY